MEDELIKKIEQSRITGKENDFVELIKGGKRVEEHTSGDISTEKKVELVELDTCHPKENEGAISCSKSFVVYTSSVKTVLLTRNDGKSKHFSFEKEVSLLKIYEESFIYLVIIFTNGSSQVLKIGYEDMQQQAYMEIDGNVFQAEKIEGDFYVMMQKGQAFQIFKYTKNIKAGEVSKTAVLESALSQSAPKFAFFNEGLYFTKNHVLHNPKKEPTKIFCRDIIPINEFLVAFDIRKRRKVLYLVTKSLQIVHEIHFSEEEFFAFQARGDIVIVSTGYRIYIYKIIKNRFKLIEILNFDYLVLRFDFLVNGSIKLFVLTSPNDQGGKSKPAEAKIKDLKSPAGEENIKNREDMKVDQAMSNRNTEDVLRDIVSKLVQTYDSERREREQKDKKMMETILEKVSEQLNKNLRIILESIVKKEIRSFLERFEGEIVGQIEKKLCSRIDSSMKSQESSFVSCAKKVLIHSVVPVIEAGFEEIKLQILEDLRQKSVGSELADDLDLLKGQKNDDTKLFNLIQRNEIIKGIELVLDSNEEVFETFLNTFEYKFLKCLEPYTIFELFRKALLINMCNGSSKVKGFLDTVTTYIAENLKIRKYFVVNANEDLISLIPSDNLLLIYSVILADASGSYKPECISILEEILKNFDTHALNSEKIYEFNDLLDTTIKVIERTGYKDHFAEAYLVVQKNYLKKKLRSFDSELK